MDDGRKNIREKAKLAERSVGFKEQSWGYQSGEERGKCSMLDSRIIIFGCEYGIKFFEEMYLVVFTSDTVNKY